MRSRPRIKRRAGKNLSPFALKRELTKTIRKTAMSEQVIDPLAKIKQKIEQEIRAVESELVNDLPKEIAKARAHGDLSENAEYKYAKERQGYVNARIGQLKKRMGDLGMLNLSNIPKDRSGYGSRIVVLDIHKEVKIEYKLVTTEEADVEKGLISTTSPIGKALLNRKVGDEVQVATPAGQKEFEIVRLTTIHEDE
jgi:transcription elongation factor GreA